MLDSTPTGSGIKWKVKYTYFTSMHLRKWCNWIDLICLGFQDFRWTQLILSPQSLEVGTRSSWFSNSQIYSQPEVNKTAGWAFIHLSNARGEFMWMQISCAVGAGTQAGWVQRGWSLQVWCHVEAALGLEGQGRFRRWMVVFALKWA